MTSDPHETYGDYSVDDEDQLPPEDTLDGDEDPLDRGYSAPDHYSAGQRFGKTPAEEERGETFAVRLRQEEPEHDPYAAERPIDSPGPGAPAEEEAMHIIEDED